LIERLPGGVTFSVRVTPRSSSPGITGVTEDAVVIRVKAAPVDDAANEELIALLARALDVPRRNVTIVSGSRSRLKRVRVSGVDLPFATRILAG
jgi:uncharacterized protein